MNAPHTHACAGCGRRVACDGIVERNHDGFPPVTCTAIHGANGKTFPVFCDRCAEQTTDFLPADAWAGGFAESH